MVEGSSPQIREWPDVCGSKEIELVTVEGRPARLLETPDPDTCPAQTTYLQLAVPDGAGTTYITPRPLVTGGQNANPFNSREALQEAASALVTLDY